MKERDYEYRGLMAGTWDLFRGDTSNWSDRFFFRDLIREQGQPVLDVGCGTGRLLLDFMQDGIDIDGVDNSPDMLALCRQRAEKLGLQPALFHQSMEALDLPRRYRTIIVPSSSFQLLTDREKAVKAMRCFYAHLEPGGLLAMPFMIIWKEGDPIPTEWKITAEKVRPEDGALMRRWSFVRYDIEDQLEHTEDRYDVVLNGEIVASEHHQRFPATRWYTQGQALQLYRDVGFTDLRVFSEFTWEPAPEDAPIFTIVGIKP